MKKFFFLSFFVMLFGCMLKAETSLFVEYLSEEESEVALSIVGRIEIKDEIFRLVDVNGVELASCDLYEVKKILFKNSSSTTNLNNLDNAHQIEVYPNPTADILFVNGLKADEVVRVYNFEGKLIAMSESNSEGLVMLSVSNLPTGTYLLQVGIEIVKFIKQ
jgi:hypothetical protein